MHLAAVAQKRGCRPCRGVLEQGLPHIKPHINPPQSQPSGDGSTPLVQASAATSGRELQWMCYSQGPREAMGQSSFCASACSPPAMRSTCVPPFLSICSHDGDNRHHVERSKEVRMDRKDGTGRG